MMNFEKCRLISGSYAGVLAAIVTISFVGACSLSPNKSKSQFDSENSSANKIAKKSTFYINDGRLMDRNGRDFVMRGVNNPHAYFKDNALNAIPNIKSLGFNTVRIVWCADTLTRSGTCEAKDQHSVSDLRAVLESLRSNSLVAVLNLQNATGSNETAHLENLVGWYTRADVVSLLNEFQDMLLINIANEWFGSWENSDNYVNGYIDAIKKIRNAGLSHVLIIDAKGYGQQFDSIPEHAPKLISLDPNIMLSAHMYHVFDTSNKVSEAFATIRESKIPFIVGEFACSHFVDQPKVACEEVMKQASVKDSEYGYIAWSYTGNGSGLNDLDIVERSDWKTLSAFGKRIINGEGGVKQTSKIASIFDTK